MTLEQIIIDERNYAARQARAEGKEEGLAKGKAILYKTLLKTGLGEQQARDAADKAYPNIPLNI